MKDQDLKLSPAVCPHPRDVPCSLPIVFLPFFINRYALFTSSCAHTRYVSERRNLKGEENNSCFIMLPVSLISFAMRVNTDKEVGSVS